MSDGDSSEDDSSDSEDEEDDDEDKESVQRGRILDLYKRQLTVPLPAVPDLLAAALKFAEVRTCVSLNTRLWVFLHSLLYLALALVLRGMNAPSPRCVCAVMSSFLLCSCPPSACDCICCAYPYVCAQDLRV